MHLDFTLLLAIDLLPRLQRLQSLFKTVVKLEQLLLLSLVQVFELLRPLLPRTLR